jgi:hypothetical protein
MSALTPVRRDPPLPPPLLDPRQAAAASQAATAALREQSLRHRAIQGFESATGAPPPGANPRAIAVADAGANARTALMSRNYSSGALQAHVTDVLQRLGNGIADGTIDPTINSAFRSNLYDLATAPETSAQFRGALAQLTRAAQVLDQVKLAKGTSLAYDPQAMTSEPTAAGLPVLNVPNIDADLYFKTSNGVLHIDSSKHNGFTLSKTLDKATTAEARGVDSQMSRHYTWANGTTAAQPRQTSYFIYDKSTGFADLIQPGRMSQLEKSIPVDAQNNRNIVIGDRSYSFNELNGLSARITPNADSYVSAQRASWTGPGAFDADAARSDFYRAQARTPDLAVKNFPGTGPTLGKAEPTVDPVTNPGVREGSIVGGITAGGISAIQQIRQGNFTWDGARQVGTNVLTGTGIGGVMAKGEQLLTPVIDRAIGPAVEANAARPISSLVSKAGTVVMPVVNRIFGSGAVQQRAAQFFGGVTSESAGLTARTVVSRIGGSTIVGAAVSAGISAWDNRAGLARGDSQAYGNVAADTIVGGTSIAAATLTGAAIGSVIPVGGTIVGGAIGLGVGLAITYGAQISGARDWMAHGIANGIDVGKSVVSHTVDTVKNSVSHAFSWL